MRLGLIWYKYAIDWSHQCFASLFCEARYCYSCCVFKQLRTSSIFLPARPCHCLPSTRIVSLEPDRNGIQRDKDSILALFERLHSQTYEPTSHACFVIGGGTNSTAGPFALTQNSESSATVLGVVKRRGGRVHVLSPQAPPEGTAWGCGAARRGCYMKLPGVELRRLLLVYWIQACQ